MEWSWRTVLILIGLVVMAAILVDGFRRMRRARAEALRLDVSNDFKFPEDGHNPELPGGGFRVIGSRRNAEADDELYTEQPQEADEQDTVLSEPVAEKQRVEPELDLPPLSVDEESSVAEPVIAWEDDISPARVVSAEKADQVLHETAAEKTHDLEIPRSHLIPKARPVNLDEPVPVLLDVEELGAEDAEPELDYQDDISAADGDRLTPAGGDEPLNGADEPAADMPEQEEGDDDSDPHLEQEVEAVPEKLPLQPVNYAGPGAESLSARPVPELVLEIHCIARDPAGFAGKDILFLFNSCDLRFGEKDIFHRFEEADGHGCIQFSVAQSFEPGVFVPAAMAQQHFRGLSFFMSLPGAKKPMDAYEAMSEMAQVVARNLNADLFDGARSALTLQTMEHDRQQIMDYERRQKLASKKQARK